MCRKGKCFSLGLECLRDKKVVGSGSGKGGDQTEGCVDPIILFSGKLDISFPQTNFRHSLQAPSIGMGELLFRLSQMQAAFSLPSCSKLTPRA